jgi:hypothetical protein
LFACHAADLRHADQNGDCGSQTDAINAGDQVKPLGQIVVLPNCADQALEFAVQEALEPADLLLPELPDTLVAARLTAGFELR